MRKDDHSDTEALTDRTMRKGRQADTGVFMAVFVHLTTGKSSLQCRTPVWEVTSRSM